MFETNFEKIQSMKEASAIVSDVRTMYDYLRKASQAFDLYVSGNDPVFNNTINFLYTVAERQNMAAFITRIKEIKTELETNYPDILGL
jgi:hypothetical protein